MAKLMQWLKFAARRLKQSILALYYACEHREVSIWPKLIAGFALAYALRCPYNLSILQPAASGKVIRRPVTFFSNKLCWLQPHRLDSRLHSSAGEL